MTKISFNFLIPYAAIIGLIVGSATGLLPREFVLLAGVFLYAALFFLRFELAAALFLATLPFQAALPLTASFDTLGMWRLAVLIMVVRWLLASGLPARIFSHSPAKLTKEAWQWANTHHFEALGIVFLSYAGLSVLWADEKIFSLRQWLHLLNIAAFYPVAKLALQRSAGLQLRALVGAGIGVFALSFVQIALAFTLSYRVFWEWWARNFAYVFYGERLRDVVLSANVWFSYWPDRPPTLRLFSVFTDSHSFGLFLLVASLALAWLIFIFLSGTAQRSRPPRWPLIGMGVLFVGFNLAIVLSGTRGILLAGLATGAISLGIFISIKISKFARSKISAPSPRVLALVFLVLLVVMPLSSMFLSLPQLIEPSPKLPSGVGAGLVLERLRTVEDLKEVSIAGRINIWKAGVAALGEHPFFGLGFGNFAKALKLPARSLYAGATAHSLYLNVAVELGMIGLTLLTAVGVALAVKLLGFVKATSSRLSQTVGWLGIIYFVWIAGYSVVDVALLDARVMLSVMLMLAFLNLPINPALRKKVFSERMS